MDEFLEEDVKRVGRPVPSPSSYSTVNTPKGTAVNASSRAPSLPVSILAGKVEGGVDGEVEGDGGDEVLLPHVLVERRLAAGLDRKSAFSVCMGKGRTLKGRDLRNVRNFVLKETGFLEGKD